MVKQKKAEISKLDTYNLNRITNNYQQWVCYIDTVKMRIGNERTMWDISESNMDLERKRSEQRMNLDVKLKWTFSTGIEGS